MINYSSQYNAKAFHPSFQMEARHQKAQVGSGPTKSSSHTENSLVGSQCYELDDLSPLTEYTIHFCSKQDTGYNVSEWFTRPRLYQQTAASVSNIWLNMRARADAARQSDWGSVSSWAGRRSAVTDWHTLALYLSPENGLLYRDGSVRKRPRDLHLSCFSLSISSHLALCSISLLLLLSSKTATSPLREAVTQLSHSRKPNLLSLLELKHEGKYHLE